MSITKQGIIEAVNRGATLLDRERPGWHQEIDLEMFNMRNSCRCVVGQLYKIVDKQRGVITCSVPWAGSRYDPTYGFDFDTNDYCNIGHDGNSDFEDTGEAWRLLEETWITLIEERKNMDIGKEERTIKVDPIEDPVPAKVPEREPQTVPRKEPAEAPRTPAPVKVPEKARG